MSGSKFKKLCNLSGFFFSPFQAKSSKKPKRSHFFGNSETNIHSLDSKLGCSHAEPWVVHVLTDHQLCHPGLLSREVFHKAQTAHGTSETSTSEQLVNKPLLLKDFSNNSNKSRSLHQPNLNLLLLETAGCWCRWCPVAVATNHPHARHWTVGHHASDHW